MQANKILQGLGKLIAAMLFAVMALAPMNAQAASDQANDPLSGITWAGSATEEDRVYLNASLQLLYEKLPDWRQTLESAKPLVIAIDLNEGAHGRAAVAKCCDAQGRGVITFGFHLGQSPDEAETLAQQVAFIGTLVHEVTHIQDQRMGRFTIKSDRKSCIVAEKSGLEKQLEVKRDLALAPLGDAYGPVLDRQIESEASALKSRQLWDLYCGAFES